MSASQDALVALRRIIRAADLQSKQLAKGAGLTPTQVHVLHTINSLPDITVGGVAREINLTLATMTTILDRLEKRGLVHRCRSNSDKRKVLVKLTESGHEVVRETPTLIHNHFVDAFEKLSDWEQSMLVASLQRVAHLIDAQDIEAAPVFDVGSLDRGTDMAAD